jgi:predicted nucleic-acid-binding protein
LSIALDTNVIVRFLARDNMKQHTEAALLISQQTCYVQDTVVLELEWVLRKTFRYERDQIVAAFDVMADLNNLKIENQLRLTSALDGYRSGMDFADAYHLAGAADADAFATFDRNLIKRASRTFIKPPVIQP